MKKEPREKEPAGRPGDKEPSSRSEGAGDGKTPAKRRPFDSVRENLEAVIVAVALALIIRHFSVEAFEIPTGSMAPTLYGIHCWVQCPNCDTQFNIGLKSDTATGRITVDHGRNQVYRGACPKCRLPHHRAFHDREEPKAGRPVALGDEFVCPNDGTKWIGQEADFKVEDVINERTFGPIACPICWYRFKEVMPSSWWHRTGGHKILVDKFSYKIWKPERWDVIVFQYDREINYIKRLIGKPGETVELKGGDVFIDGKIERKHTRPEIQEVLWTKVHDLDVPERGFQKTPAWKEVFPPAPGVPAGSWSWDGVARRWSANTTQAGAGKTAALRYQRPLVNYYNYNVLHHSLQGVTQLGSSDPQVGDKKVSFLARIPRGAKGWIGAEIQDGRFSFQARIPIGSPDPANPATLRRLPPESDPERFQANRPPLPEEAGRPWPSAELAIRPDAAARIEFENVDDRVALRIDGEEVLSLEYDSGAEVPPGPEANNVFLIAGDGASCTLESIRVFRDIHYTYSGDINMRFGVGKPIRLAADGEANEYFACGDNSPSSSDGRFWGPIPERNLMGKGLLVFWPLWPTNWQFKLIR